MRALTFTRYGGPEAMSLTSVPEPIPGEGELLIDVTAVGLNPVDALQREGTFRAVSPFRFPKVAGNEVSGVVAGLGHGVQGVEIGQPVIARVDKNGLGAFAEYAVTRAEFVAPAPSSVSLTDAAGLPLAGLTAQQGLGPEHLDVQPGDSLLITGAAGGVGQLAVQLAVLAGAEVTATASPDGEDIVRRAGAGHVINYRERKVSEGPERFSKVFDLVGGDTVSDVVDAVEPGGRVVSISGPPTPGSLGAIAVPSRRLLAALAERVMSRGLRQRARAKDISYEFFFMVPDGAGLAELARLVDEGRLELPIDSRYPFEQYAGAFARLESRRAKGKILLEM